MSEIRKLATIVFADIAGYTSLMQKDEDQALDFLNQFKEILESNTSRHGGQLVQYFGDACLLTFESSTQAVKCALELQHAFRTSGIPVRIGMHLGEVVFKNNNAFGDGVNIASRIESLGVPGSILLSKQIRNQMRNKSDFHLVSLGSFDFKNVDESMEIFALSNPGLAIPKAGEITGKLQPAKSGSSLLKIIGVIAGLAIVSYFLLATNGTNQEEPVNISAQSIAVLPFADMSPEKDQEYFSDGMMEEILNHLVKIEGLLVSSRTSSMTYKGSSKKAAEIARELGVANILEGSVRKAGDQLRITVQFIDGTTDKHLWSETYDGALDNVFAIQSDIARKVAQELRAQISPEVEERIEQVPTENMVAYSLYLEGRNAFRLDVSDSLMLEAIRLDPDFGEAYGILARNKLYQIIFSRGMIVSNLEEYLQEVNGLLDKSLSLNPHNADAYIHKGAINLWFEWDFEKARSQYEEALRLNPSFNYIAYAEFLLAMGDFEEALQESKRNTSANRSSSYGWVIEAMTDHFLGEHKRAEEAIAIAKITSSEDTLTNSNFLRLLIYQGRYEEMLVSYSAIPADDLYPRAMGFAALAYYHTGRQSEVDRIIETLKQQSNESPIGSPAYHLAMIYAQMRKVDLAFEWLDKAHQDREIEMYWLKVEPPLEPLHGDPRWTELLFKVGFEVPVKG